MLGSVVLENPYEKVYRSFNFIQTSTPSRQTQTQELIRHLGFMYNTFGEAIKDFVKIVSSNFQKEQEIIQPTVPLQNQNSKGKNLFKKNVHNEKKTTQCKNYRKSGSPQYSQNLLRKQLPPNAFSCDVEVGKPCDQKEKSASCQLQIQEQSNQQPSSNKIKTTIPHSLNDPHQFHSQFLPASSPIKSSAHDRTLLQLSHKQKFTDQSHLIIEEDEVVPVINLVTDYQQPFHTIDQHPEMVNPVTNQVDVNVRIVGGRKKKDRQNLLGVSCLQCEKYYKAMQIKGQNMCRCTSRHRSNLPLNKVKKHFTQQIDLK